MKCCKICGNFNDIEEHHIIKRSQAGFLINCELNKVYLCVECHRGTNGVHGKNGHKLDKLLKFQLQNYLEMHLLKEYISREEIKAVLEIKDKPLDRLLKSLRMYKGKYAREDVILKCMADKKVTEDEILELDI